MTCRGPVLRFAQDTGRYIPRGVGKRPVSSDLVSSAGVSFPAETAALVGDLGAITRNIQEPFSCSTAAQTRNVPPRRGVDLGYKSPGECRIAPQAYGRPGQLDGQCEGSDRGAALEQRPMPVEGG